MHTPTSADYVMGNVRYDTTFDPKQYVRVSGSRNKRSQPVAREHVEASRTVRVLPDNSTRKQRISQAILFSDIIDFFLFMFRPVFNRPQVSSNPLNYSRVQNAFTYYITIAEFN
jgi:hypothetical protein